MVQPHTHSRCIAEMKAGQPPVFLLRFKDCQVKRILSFPGQPFPGLLCPPLGEASPKLLPIAAGPMCPGALAQEV